MANWLDKYEQGGMVLKKKTKDNYGKRENPNDVKASVGPDFVGLGYNTKGRDYSPAWGGQFQNGGVMNKASMFASLPTPTDIYNYGRRESEEIAKRAKLMWESKSLNPTLPMHSDTLYPGNKYKDAFMKTPNIRTKKDESFKKGHSLTNEQKAIVLHHTGYTDTARDNDVSWAMRGVDAQFRKPGESSHVVIDFNGNRYNYANPNQVTFHAGKSSMNNKNDVNDFGVGVEFQGDTDQRPLTKEQIESFIEYAAPIIKKNKIPINNVITHKQIRKNYIDKNLNDKDVQSKPDINDKEYSKIIQALKKKDVLQMGGSIPGAVGFMYARTQDPAPSNGKYAKKTKASAQNGSVIKDDRGQWAYPGEVTEIGSNNITMQGVDYPVLGVSDTGDTQMMQPNQDYKFDGEKVTEFPMAQDGENINKKLKKEAEEKLERLKKPKATISQYTPKKGEAERLDKQKLERIAEDNAPLNRMAASQGAKNMQDAIEAALIMEGGMAAGKFVGKGAKAAGKYLTEETALKNAYKLNPYAFKPTEGMMYRGIGKEGMEDALQSGLFRAKQNVTPTSLGNFNTTRQFSKAYYSPRFDIADQYGQGYIAEVPRAASDWGKRYGKKEWSQIAQRDIPTTEGKVLQKDWLKRYKEVPQPTSTQRVTRGPVNYWEEPGFAKRNPNFNPEAYENSPIGNASASRDIPEGMTPYIKVDDVTPNVKPSWKSQELPGLHISATMEGGPISKIIEPKTGLINVDQALTIIGKESGGASKVDMIKQVLGKDIPKKMDYNDFRKTVQDQLIPLEREVVNTFRSAYNIDKLGYTKASADGKDIILNRINNTKADILKLETEGTPWGDTYLKRLKENLETDLKEYSNLPLENQTIRLSNRSKFGKGADTHGNPEETLGHIHFLRDAESPDVLTMTQLQSDAFQSTNRTMPKSLEEANAKLNKLKDDVNYTYKTFGNSPADLQTFKDVINKAKESLSLEEASVKNFSQKSLLDKNHQERYLQELVDYAGKRGDINKIRVPTSETAAKVQGYKETSLTGDNAPGFGKLQEEISVAVRQGDQQKVNDLMKVHDEMLKTPYKTYSSDQKTILKKYSEQPKVIKKVFGVEPKTVKDSKGNSWYEFDIPAKFKGGKGEIKAFEDGGWLNKYK